MLRKLLFWSLAVVFPFPLVQTYDSLATDPGPLKFYIFLGLIAYTWWLLSIMLSVRPSWLHRFVGLPSIYGLHGMLGVLAIVAAYMHREYSYSPSQLARDLGDWAFYGALAVLCFAVFFMSGWLVDRSRLLLKAKGILEIVFRRQFSVWIHRLNLVVVAMIWLHAHLLVRVNQYFAFMVLFDFYTVAALSVYAWNKWIAPDTYLMGSVISNEARGGSTRRVSVGLDSKARSLRPGDFFFLRFEGSTAVSREWHPFSVTDADQKTLAFTIRQHGDFTRRLDDVEAERACVWRGRSAASNRSSRAATVRLRSSSSEWAPESRRCSVSRQRITPRDGSTCCGPCADRKTPITAMCSRSTRRRPAIVCGSPSTSAGSAARILPTRCPRRQSRRARSSSWALTPPCWHISACCDAREFPRGVYTRNGSPCRRRRPQFPVVQENRDRR